MNKKPSDYLALALDNFTTEDKLLQLVDLTADYIGVYKIGLEQFIRFGPPIISIIKRDGQSFCQQFADCCFSTSANAHYQVNHRNILPSIRQIFKCI